MSVHAPSPVASLYVHVPFCAHKCEYCAFYSEASHGDKINRYVTALVREAELVAADLRPRTIFFGGGTPSLLNVRQWQQILQAMERLELLGAEEWIIECNPATVSLDKARLWQRYGVNRISMGVQSFDEGMLDRLGRIHTREMVFKSYDILRRAGFENINLDLMFAIPGQTMAMWRATLREAVQLGTEHLSCYEVIYEENTPLYEQLKAGEFAVDEDLAGAMFDQLIEYATEAAFVQYEIANFARDRKVSGCQLPTADCQSAPGNSEIPHLACHHNINYWRGGQYYGLGPSAAEYVNGVRGKNWSNTALYCEQLEQGRRAVESRDELSPLGRAGEIAAFGLRMNAGWPFDVFRQSTGFDLRREWAPEIDQLVAGGFARVNEERVQLTPRGLRFADWVAEQFLREDRLDN